MLPHSANHECTFNLRLKEIFFFSSKVQGFSDCGSTSKMTRRIKYILYIWQVQKVSDDKNFGKQ